MPARNPSATGSGTPIIHRLIATRKPSDVIDTRRPSIQYQIALVVSCRISPQRAPGAWHQPHQPADVQICLCGKVYTEKRRHHKCAHNFSSIYRDAEEILQHCKRRLLDAGVIIWPTLDWPMMLSTFAAAAGS